MKMCACGFFNLSELCGGSGSESAMSVHQQGEQAHRASHITGGSHPSKLPLHGQGDHVSPEQSNVFRGLN